MLFKNPDTIRMAGNPASGEFPYRRLMARTRPFLRRSCWTKVAVLLAFWIGAIPIQSAYSQNLIFQLKVSDGSTAISVDEEGDLVVKEQFQTGMTSLGATGWYLKNNSGIVVANVDLAGSTAGRMRIRGSVNSGLPQSTHLFVVRNSVDNTPMFSIDVNGNLYSRGMVQNETLDSKTIGAGNVAPVSFFTSIMPTRPVILDYDAGGTGSSNSCSSNDTITIQTGYHSPKILNQQGDFVPAAKVRWTLRTNRLGYSNRILTFKYTDQDIAGLGDERYLRLYFKSHDADPYLGSRKFWNDAVTQHIDIANNLISVESSIFNIDPAYGNLELTIASDYRFPVIPNGGNPPLRDFYFEKIVSPGGVLTSMAFTPDNNFLLLADKDGIIRVLKRSFTTNRWTQQTTDFIDIRNLVNSDVDRGLMGMELHPGFSVSNPNTNWIYLYYTYNPDPESDPNNDWDYLESMATGTFPWNRVVRYQAELVGGTILQVKQSVNPQVVIDKIPAIHNSHVGGALRFGNDGSLIIATGDAAHWDIFPFDLDPANDPDVITDRGDFGARDNPAFGSGATYPSNHNEGAFRARDIDNLAGKLLRLNLNGTWSSSGAPGYYNVSGKVNNPFANVSNINDIQGKIWALGLRNPFKATIKPDGSITNRPGKIYVNDVGWFYWEEIHVSQGNGTTADNFGWPVWEGGERTDFEKTLGFDPAHPENYFNTYANYVRNPPVSGLADSTTMYGTDRKPYLAWPHNKWPDGAAGVASDPDPKFSVNYPTSGISYYSTLAPTVATTQRRFIGNTAVGGVYAAASPWAYPLPFQNGLFVADFARFWIRFIKEDGSGNASQVYDFASPVIFPGELRIDPYDGTLFFCSPAMGEVTALRYGGNRLETRARVYSNLVEGNTTTNLYGMFTSHSRRLENQLTYQWYITARPQGVTTAGQPIALTAGKNPTHTFSSSMPGAYTLRLDVSGGSAPLTSDEITVFVDQTPPAVDILDSSANPFPDLFFGELSAGNDIDFEVDDPDGSTTYDWQTNLVHVTNNGNGSHVHPRGNILEDSSSGTFPVTSAGSFGSDMEYHELVLNAFTLKFTNDSKSHVLSNSEHRLLLDVAQIPNHLGHLLGAYGSNDAGELFRRSYRDETRIQILCDAQKFGALNYTAYPGLPSEFSSIANLKDFWFAMDIPNNVTQVNVEWRPRGNAATGVNKPRFVGVFSGDAKFFETKYDDYNLAGLQTPTNWTYLHLGKSSSATTDNLISVTANTLPTTKVIYVVVGFVPSSSSTDIPMDLEITCTPPSCN